MSAHEKERTKTAVFLKGVAELGAEEPRRGGREKFE